MANRKYLELFDAQIEQIKQGGMRPPLLLQACCAPCGSAVLELLIPIFEISLFFNGHNIYPYAEYERRKLEVEKIVEIMNRDFNGDVELIVIEPEIEKMTQRLAFGADQKEGGSRCQACYGVRFKEMCDYAVKHGFTYVSTVMTISRQKCSEKINTVAEAVVKQYPDLVYLYSDFKKRKGNDRSRELCRAYDIYQQQYCGCLYSLKEKMERDKQREQNI